MEMDRNCKRALFLAMRRVALRRVLSGEVSNRVIWVPENTSTKYAEVGEVVKVQVPQDAEHFELPSIA